MLLAAPILAALYVFVLGTTFFDIRPQPCPDLELVPPTGASISLRAALEACPEYEEWIRVEKARSRDLDPPVWDAKRKEWRKPASAPSDWDKEWAAQALRAFAIVKAVAVRPERLGLPEDPSFRFELFSPRYGVGSVGLYRRMMYQIEVLAWYDGPFEGPRPDPLEVWEAITAGLGKIDEQATTVMDRRGHLKQANRAGKLGLELVRRRGNSSRPRTLEAMQQAWSRLRSQGRQPLLNAMRGSARFLAEDARELRNYVWCPTDLYGPGLPSSFWSETTLYDWWMILRIQPNRTARDLDARTRDSLPLIDLLPQQRPPMPPEPRYAWECWLPSPNCVGKSFALGAANTNRGAIESEDLAEARHSLVAVVVALARFRLDHGNTLPSTLADLVPGYLPAVPRDPFDGKPVRYDTPKGHLWSIGLDLADHGGKPYRNREDEEPPVPGTDALWPDDRYTECDDEPTVDLKAFFGDRATEP